MSSKVSTLTVSLKDDVSGKAGQIGKALKTASDQARAMAQAMNGTGASKGFVNNLARLGLSAKDIERVSASLKDYAKAAGLAGDAASWTKDQAARIRQWEAATIASLRHVAAEQKTVAKGALDVAAGMARASAITAQGRRVAEGMGAPGRAAALQREAAALAVVQARTAALARANDGLTRSMSRASAVTADGRHVAERMSAPARAAVASRAAAEAEARERAVARAGAQADARKALAGMAGVALGHKVKEGTRATLHTYREFDKERRFGKAVMGLTDEEQKPLVDQAVHMGATTKYNDVQVLEAQRELSARGLKKDQVLGMMDAASKLGMSLDLSLPAAVKQMEGALFGFKKPIGTLDEALASARQTADLQVKAAKVSGMTPEDITQAYKYAATPARMGGLSEETMLAFSAISKKANMGGDESGVAFRALVANVLSPTRKAKEAMLANGMDPKNYQRNPDRIDTGAFTKTVAAQYGVKLDKGVQAGLEKIFTDKAMIADPSKFTPAVMKLLGDNLGGDDAKSKKSIAGLANRFRDASMKGVDSNAMVEDMMGLIAKNPALANAIFGSKQGGRIANALGDPAYFKKVVDELKNHSEGYSEAVSKERMAGYDGAASRFEGAVKNLETAMGRAWDDDGKGGFLTGLADKAAKATMALAEMPRSVLQVGSALTWLGGKAASVAGTAALVGAAFSLKGSAGALAGSATALTAAAARLAGGSLLKDAVPAAVTAGLATGLGLITVAVTGAIAAGFALKASTDMLPKVANSVGPGGVDPATGGLVEANPMEGMAPDKPWLKEWLQKQLPSVFGERKGSLPPGAAGMPQPPPARLPGLDGRTTPKIVPESFGPHASTTVPLPPRRPEAFGPPATSTAGASAPTVAPKGDDAGVRQVQGSTEQLKQALDQVNGTTVAPQASGEGLRPAQAAADQLLSTLRQIKAEAGGVGAAVEGAAAGGLRARRSAASFQGPDYAGP